MMMRILSLLFLLWTAQAQAAWHLYLVPIVGAGTEVDPKHLKYFFGSGQVMTASPTCSYRYGAQPHAMVAADVDNTIDAKLAGLGDVVRIPDSLDNPIGAGALAAVRNALESRQVPGGWITPDITYRTLIRVAIGLFQFAQRYAAISGNNLMIDGNKVTLATQFGDLPAQARADLQVAASGLGFDYGVISLNSTVGQMLSAIGAQSASTPQVLCGVMI